jgi:hypothetical protein
MENEIGRDLCEQAGRFMVAAVATAESSPEPVFGVLEVVSAVHRNRPALFEALWEHLQEHTDYESVLVDPEEVTKWIVEGDSNLFESPPL